MATSSTSYQAPSLHFNGEKEQDNPTHQSAIRPQKLEDILFRELGNSSAQLRIMLVLTGTKEGFFISEKWICERTGLLQQSYSRALKALIDRGWLSHTAYSTITINFDKIYEDGRRSESDETTLYPNNIRGHPNNMVLSEPEQHGKCSDTTPCCV